MAKRVDAGEDQILYQSNKDIIPILPVQLIYDPNIFLKYYTISTDVFTCVHSRFIIKVEAVLYRMIGITEEKKNNIQPQQHLLYLTNLFDKAALFKTQLSLVPGVIT